MKKNYFIFLFCSLLLSGLSFAAQQPAPYPAAFWINGTLTASGPSGVDGYKVIFYKTSNAIPNNYDGGYALNVSANGGKFSINAMDDLRMLPLAAGNYFIGVVGRTVNGVVYGVSQTTINLVPQDLTNGYFNKDLTLAAGQGITDPQGPLTIATLSLPNGTVNQAYSTTLNVTGGALPLTWSIISGGLPLGLTLDPAKGIISGTPSVRGTSNFTLRVTDTNGATDEKNLSINVSYSVIDIPYGPQINLEAIFQALAGVNGSNTVPQIVRVEARTLQNGTVPLNSANLATKLVGYADLILNSKGNTVGRNGFLKPDGTEFSANTPLPDHDYYLVVKQWLAPDPKLIGVGHLSVITSRPITLKTGLVDRDGSTTSLDITNDPAVVDAPADKIYNETPYAPQGLIPALFTSNGRTLLRAGDLDGNGYVDVIDTSHWYRLFKRFNSGAADVPNDPYIRADLNQNGLIDVVDMSWWYGTFKNLTLDSGNAGPHGYVPLSQ